MIKKTIMVLLRKSNLSLNQTELEDVKMLTVFFFYIFIIAPINFFLVEKSLNKTNRAFIHKLRLLMIFIAFFFVSVIYFESWEPPGFSSSLISFLEG